MTQVDKTYTASGYRPCYLLASRAVHLAATACGSRLNALALADLHGGLIVDGGSSHTLLDLSGHGQESLLDIRRILCRRLEEWDSKTVSKFLQGQH